MDMNYLEKAKEWGNKVFGTDTYEGEQSRATVTIALALIAIAEHLVAFGTGAAMRREIDKLAIGFDEIESKLAGVVVQHVNDFAGIDREIETVKRQQTASLDATAANAMMRQEIDKLSARVSLEHNERLENLERGKVTIGKGGEVVEMVDGATAVRLDEIERRLKKIESEDVELGRYVKNVLEGRFANIERKLPDASPRVGVWQQCAECEGKGLDPDPDAEGARCGVCDGSGTVEAYVKKSGRTSEAEWADKLQEAHFSVASLERKLEESRRTIDEILQVVNDSDLSHEEMIKEVDKALR